MAEASELNHSPVVSVASSISTLIFCPGPVDDEDQTGTKETPAQSSCSSSSRSPSSSASRRIVPEAQKGCTDSASSTSSTSSSVFTPGTSISRTSSPASSSARSWSTSTSSYYDDFLGWSYETSITRDDMLAWYGEDCDIPTYNAGIAYELAGRRDARHTYQDLRSAARARNRDRANRKKYWNYRVVHREQVRAARECRREHGFKSPLVPCKHQPHLDKQKIYYEAQQYPRPPTYHHRHVDKERGGGVGTRYCRRMEERKTACFHLQQEREDAEELLHLEARVTSMEYQDGVQRVLESDHVAPWTWQDNEDAPDLGFFQDDGDVCIVGGGKGFRDIWCEYFLPGVVEERRPRAIYVGVDDELYEAGNVWEVLRMLRRQESTGREASIDDNQSWSATEDDDGFPTAAEQDIRDGDFVLLSLSCDEDDGERSGSESDWSIVDK